MNNVFYLYISWFQYFVLISKVNYTILKTINKIYFLITVCDFFKSEQMIVPHLSTHETLGFTLVMIILNLENQEFP